MVYPCLIVTWSIERAGSLNPSKTLAPGGRDKEPSAWQRAHLPCQLIKESADVKHIDSAGNGSVEYLASRWFI
jgi:hypothetical protein